MDEGRTLFTQHRDFRGGLERVNYRWEGGPKIKITWELICEFTEGRDPLKERFIQIGPYRVCVIDRDPMYNYYECVRVDYPLWWLVVGWHRFGRVADLAFRRFILTLAVWRLASYNPALVLSWRDIHLVEWLRRRRKDG